MPASIGGTSAPSDVSFWVQFVAPASIVVSKDPKARVEIYNSAGWCLGIELHWLATARTLKCMTEKSVREPNKDADSIGCSQDVLELAASVKKCWVCLRVPEGRMRLGVDFGVGDAVQASWISLRGVLVDFRGEDVVQPLWHAFLLLPGPLAVRICCVLDIRKTRNLTGHLQATWRVSSSSPSASSSSSSGLNLAKNSAGWT